MSRPDADVSLDRLQSREEIRQLVYRYAISLDARDLDTLAGLFLDDVDVEPDRIGGKGIRDAFDRTLGRIGRSILFVGNHLIDFDDADHAHGTVYCRAEIEMGDEWIVQAIAYHDRYQRRDGRWYFHDRNHLLFYGADMLERPIGLPPARKPEYGTGRGSMPEYWPTYTAFRQRHAGS